MPRPNAAWLEARALRDAMPSPIDVSATSAAPYAIGDIIKAHIDAGNGGQLMDVTIVDVFPSYRVRTSAGVESVIYADSISSKVSGSSRRRKTKKSKRRVRKTRRSRK